MAKKGQEYELDNSTLAMMTMQCLPVRSQCLIMLKTEKGWEAMILRMSKEGWLVKRKSGGLVVL